MSRHQSANDILRFSIAPSLRQSRQYMYHTSLKEKSAPFDLDPLHLFQSSFSRYSQSSERLDTHPSSTCHRHLSAHADYNTKKFLAHHTAIQKKQKRKNLPLKKAHSLISGRIHIHLGQEEKKKKERHRGGLNPRRVDASTGERAIGVPRPLTRGLN